MQCFCSQGEPDDISRNNQLGRRIPTCRLVREEPVLTIGGLQRPIEPARGAQLVQPSAVEFERIALPHAAAALSLARALVRREADAEDVVQEAFMRAFKYFRGFSGGHPRAWLLSIVRNVAYAILRKNGQTELVEGFDEERDPSPSPWSSEARPETPESTLLRAIDAEAVQRALQSLPAEFREVVVLRELEQCSYKEIADIVHVPMGTVMSRLSRARKALHTRLSSHGEGGAKG